MKDLKLSILQQIPAAPLALALAPPLALALEACAKLNPNTRTVEPLLTWPRETLACNRSEFIGTLKAICANRVMSVHIKDSMILEDLDSW